MLHGGHLIDDCWVQGRSSATVPDLSKDDSAFRAGLPSVCGGALSQRWQARSQKLAEAKAATWQRSKRIAVWVVFCLFTHAWFGSLFDH
jgi:hypothetical protein